MDRMISCGMQCGLGAKGPASKAGRLSARVREFRYSVTGQIPAGVGTGLTTLTLPVFDDSYMVIQKLIAISDNDFFTLLNVPGSGNMLANNPIRKANMWGTAQLPAILLDPLVVAPSALLQFFLTNNNAGANNVQLVVEGYRHFDVKNPPHFKRPGLVQFFAYSWGQTSSSGQAPNQIVLGANQTQTYTLRIDNDADFVARKYLAQSTGDFQITIYEGSSKEPWMDNPTRRDNMFGTAQYPAVPFRSRRITRNTVVLAEITDLTGAPNTIQLALEGAKVRV